MADKSTLKIGLALSGGGVRAAVFHLGILGRLAADNLLEQITFISTVSGGTLVTGLIYATNGYYWPSSADFLTACLPQVYKYLTQTNLQKDVTVRTLLQPWYLLQGRAKVVSQSMQRCWNITANLSDIPLEPRWILNATAYESGRNWRFIPQRRMGDYTLHSVNNPQIALTDAMAATAAYPGLIGPLVLYTNEYEWFRYEGVQEVLTKPVFKKLHLWDGGVYDNLGVEALFKMNGSGFRSEINFAIISDASNGTELTHCPPNLYTRANRLVGIAMDQVRSLRARSLIYHFDRNKNTGVYMKMGNPSRKILENSGIGIAQIDDCCKTALSDEFVRTAVTFPTTLRQLTDDEFRLLFTHGWEVANCTLHSRCIDWFDYTNMAPF